MDGLAHSAGLLEQIKTPVRFIWGEEDLFGGTHTAHAFVAHFPDAELDLVAGAGHAPWIDDPAHVADLATDFLSR